MLELWIFTCTFHEGHNGNINLHLAQKENTSY